MEEVTEPPEGEKEGEVDDSHSSLHLLDAFNILFFKFFNFIHF